MPTVIDALGRTIALSRPAKRVVSLVPSETFSVYELSGLDLLCGRTTYCEEPRGAIDTIPTCGGTKNVDVAKVVELKPDLVLANQEENSKKEIERLIELGLPVHVSFPKTLEESREFLSSLATLIGAPESSPALLRVDESMSLAFEFTRAPLRVFVPIWMEPLMTFDGRAFASAMLARAGAENVFADRARRYPLAADLGMRDPLPEKAVGERDTRYPRVTLAEVEQRSPDAILLPDEPHPFSKADEDVFRALNTPASKANQVVQIDGKDLFWYGTRVARAIPRLCAAIDRIARTP